MHTSRETAEQTDVPSVAAPPARIAALDFIRAIAILLVVLNHSVESIYPMTPDAMRTLAFPARIFPIVCFTLGRLGVPLFLFLCACLLLNRIQDSQSCIAFWRSKLVPLFVTWEVWIILYYLFQTFVFNKAFSARELMKMLLLMQQVDLSHAWYMPAILGIYIFLPFLSVVVRTFDLKALLFPLGIAYYAFFLSEAIHRFTGTGAYSLLDVSFSGGVYGFYIVIGYLFYYRIRKDAHIKKSAFLFLLSFGAYIAIQLWECSLGVWELLLYAFPMLPIVSICLFSVLLDCKRICNWALWRRLSLLSFGIYLVHRPIQLMLLQLLRPGQPSPALVLTFFLLSFLLSLCIVWLLSKLPPKIRRILLLQK